MVHVSADNIVTLRQILHSRTNRWLRGKAASGIWFNRTTPRWNI